MHLRLASRGNFEVACSNHHFTNCSFSIAAPAACNHCLSSTIKVSDFNTLTSFSSLLNKHLYVFHFPAHSNYSIFIYLHFVLVFYSILKFSNRSHSLRLANFSCSIRAYNCLPMCKRICWYPEVKYSSKKILNRPDYSSQWKHETEIVNLHIGFRCWGPLPLLSCGNADCSARETVSRCR